MTNFTLKTFQHLDGGCIQEPSFAGIEEDRYDAMPQIKDALSRERTEVSMKGTDASKSKEGFSGFANILIDRQEALTHYTFTKNSLRFDHNICMNHHDVVNNLLRLSSEEII